MVKIGLIKETKIPVDNRVALTPDEIIKLQKQYPEAEFYVQSSELRAYHDDEYRNAGIPVVDSVSNCDFLFGIKEAEGVCKSGIEQCLEFLSLLVGKTGIHAVGLRVLQVDFLMCYI